MIELKNISGGYGKNTVITDVSAVFNNGEITSVVGANGCGKSTLLMMCAGLLPLTSGSVLIDGEDISKLSRNVIAKRISYLAQSKSMGNISVRSLVSHGRFPYLGYPRRYAAADTEKINEAMELAQVTDISDKPVCELSGGQKQRVRIAMILAQDTENVLLDEPLTYLDIRHQYELMELIVKLKNMGKAIVTVMHDLNFALRCSDKIAVMENGAITALDAPKSIVQNDALPSALGVKAIYSPDEKQYFFEPNKL